MTVNETDHSPERQVQAARKAFDQDIERFVRFCEPSQLSQLDLETAIAEERAFAEVRARHLGQEKRSRRVEEVNRPRGAGNAPGFRSSGPVARRCDGPNGRED